MPAWYRSVGPGREVFLRTQTMDVSATGATVYGPSQLNDSERIDLTLRLDDGSYVSLRARPVGCRSYGEGSLISLRFESDALAERATLKNWLQRKSRYQ